MAFIRLNKLASTIIGCFVLAEWAFAAGGRNTVTFSDKLQGPSRKADPQQVIDPDTQLGSQSCHSGKNRGFKKGDLVESLINLHCAKDERYSLGIGDLGTVVRTGNNGTFDVRFEGIAEGLSPNHVTLLDFVELRRKFGEYEAHLNMVSNSEQRLHEVFTSKGRSEWQKSLRSYSYWSKDLDHEKTRTEAQSKADDKNFLETLTREKYETLIRNSKRIWLDSFSQTLWKCVKTKVSFLNSLDYFKSMVNEKSEDNEWAKIKTNKQLILNIKLLELQYDDKTTKHQEQCEFLLKLAPLEAMCSAKKIPSWTHGRVSEEFRELASIARTAWDQAGGNTKGSCTESKKTYDALVDPIRELGPVKYISDVVWTLIMERQQGVDIMDRHWRRLRGLKIPPINE